MMKINVGSTNRIKLSAVAETIALYPDLCGADVISIDVPSNVSSQPRSLTETIEGARYRARAAFNQCKYSFGIEDGLIEVPYTKTGYMNISACIIYDGREEYLGLSPAFELPRAVFELIIRDGLDMSEAFYKSGFTTNRKLGAAEGAVGLLTENRLQRKEYTGLAIKMALIGLEDKSKSFNTKDTKV